jgi:parallel beta-helix repeat protein
VVTYTVTTSGGNPPVTLSVTPTSGSSFAVGTTTVQANAQSQDGQTKSCSFTVTVTAASSDWTFCAVEGGFCAFTGTQQVRYGANGSYFYETLSGGTACTNSVFGDPIVGVAKQCAIAASAVTNDWTFCAAENQTCAFTGTREVRYGANTSYNYLLLSNGTPCTNNVFGDPISGTVKHCDIKTTAPPSTSYGPRPTITCPAGAVDILPGQSIQLIVNANAAGTTFCLRAGVHPLTSSIRPQTGNTFVGEYGAALDGTGWTTTDDTQSAFRAYDDPNDPNDPSGPIDNVTIRNLVIHNMPQWAIHGHYQVAHHWTIEYNEIASNKWGLLFGPDFTVRNNYIHHNIGTSGPTAQLGGGYIGLFANNTTFDSNEIAYNGTEQKVAQSTNVTFRDNFVHHNAGDGIWYDTNPNAAALIDGNRVEDNGRNGIFFEASIGATISNNTIKRHTSWDGIFISMSQNAQIFSNTLEGNYGASTISSTAMRWLGGRCQEQCGARQHARRQHADRYVRERLLFHLLVQLNPARAVSEWLEKPDLHPQHVPGAVTLLYAVFLLGRLEGLESVAAGAAGWWWQQHLPVAAEARLPCSSSQSLQLGSSSLEEVVHLDESNASDPGRIVRARILQSSEPFRSEVIDVASRYMAHLRVSPSLLFAPPPIGTRSDFARSIRQSNVPQHSDSGGQ